MNRQPLLLFGLVAASVFVLSLSWEFLIEDLVLFGRPAGRTETIAERWEFVLTSMTFVLLSLIAPFVIAVRNNAKLARMVSELRQAAAVFEHTLDGVLITDARGTVVAVNQAFTQLTGFTSDEVVGESPSILKSGRHDQEFYQTMWAALAREGVWNGEIWNRDKSGEIMPIREVISTVKDGGGRVRGYVAVMSDITAVKLTEERLRHLAHHDPLTDLPNRLLFEDRLGHAIERAHREERKIAVLYCDLDDFKPINDQFGHALGDRVLREIGERLVSCVREVDTVARMGGDEFTVILESVRDRQQAQLVADKILAALDRPHEVGGQVVTVRASIGIGVHPDDGMNAKQLVERADAAMYRAKKRGGHRYG